MAAPAQPGTSPSAAAKRSHALTAVGGAGIGVALATVLQGHPEIIAQVATAWGAPMILLAGVIFGIGYLADKHLPPLVSAHVGETAAISRLTAVMETRFTQEDDVRMATRSLSGDVQRLSEKVDGLGATIVKEIATLRGEKSK